MGQWKEKRISCNIFDFSIYFTFEFLLKLKAVHNNIMTIMENRVMQMTGCNRQTANLVANEVLDLDRDADMLLNEKESD